MKQSHLCFAIAGFCLGACPKGIAQPVVRDTLPIQQSGACQGCKAVDSSAMTQAQKQLPARKKILSGLHMTGGQLTVPFKIRPNADHGTFRLTTDVTLGAFVGLTKRLSAEKDHFLTIPMTAGLTFVNLSDNNTSVEFAALNEGGNDVVPGLTWSSGIILQLDQYNLGLIFGKDFASEVGDQWLYHKQWWWSFGLGFSFTQ